MRLRQLELSAFRGFKEPTTIRFGTGFTIITGRNGSGKSSICDALEYVLTQHLSRFGPTDVEGGERIDDYIWWRNGTRSANRQVKAVFDLDDGTVGERTATPTGIENTFDQSVFYDKRPQVSDPFALLSQTMLIRDESIIKFSTDLPEADRFEFFYRAIGLTDLVKIEDRANTLVKQLGRKTEDLEKEYRQRRETVAQIISEISEARTTAARTTAFDAAALQKRLANLTGLPPETPLRQLAAGVTRTLADQKSRIDRLERLNEDLSQSRSWLEDLRRFEEKRDVVKTSLDAAEAALKDAGNSRMAAGEALRQAQAHNLRLGALAQLRELRNANRLAGWSLPPMRVVD
jgi:chromosome segregation protein